MEVKKNPQVDLERNKGTFSLIGLVLVLGIVLSAFEYRTTEDTVASLGELGDMQIEEEIIPITRQQEVKPPPPPKPKVVEVIEIVEDDVEIEEELEIEDTEADQETEVIEVVEVEEEESDEVFGFAVIEDKPVFPGGDAALMKYLATNTKFPPVAKENGIQGRVFVGFVIDKNGKVVDVEILRGVDPHLDREALRVVKSMPSWKPGKQRGKPVKVRYQVPINFKLF